MTMTVVHDGCNLFSTYGKCISVELVTNETFTKMIVLYCHYVIQKKQGTVKTVKSSKKHLEKIALHNAINLE